MDFSPEQRRTLLDWARAAIRQTLAGFAVRPPACHDLDLLQLAGCFVTLHGPGGALRGCIGRLDASEPLVGALTASAVSVLGDPRFRHAPITVGELPQLELELSILSPLRPAKHVLDFDLLNEGIVLMLGNHSGCFLPQVARESGWTREQLLSKLCTEKMGLPPNSWQNPSAKLSVFSALIVGPEPFERPIVHLSSERMAEVSPT